MTTPQATLTDAMLDKWRIRATAMLCDSKDDWFELKAVFAAARAHLSAGGWREIASAPKDGTHVLLGFLPHVGWVLTGCYRNDVGWVCAWDWKEITETPTHWQPLPEPPTPSGEEQK